MKLKTTKFSFEGLGGNSTKFYTSENFPLFSSSFDPVGAKLLCIALLIPDVHLGSSILHDSMTISRASIQSILVKEG